MTASPVRAVACSPHLPIRGRRAATTRRQLDGDAKRAIETGRTRLLVGARALRARLPRRSPLRLVDVTLLSDGAEPRLPHRRPPQRAGRSAPTSSTATACVLATNLATASLFANPQQMHRCRRGGRASSPRRCPISSATELRAKLDQRQELRLAQAQPDAAQQYAVNRLGIPGLDFQREERRVYPQGALTAHVVGFTDIDNHGLAGIEQSFDDALRDGRTAGRSCRSISACSTSCARSCGAAIDDFTRHRRRRHRARRPAPARSWPWSRCPTSIPTSRRRAGPRPRFNRATLGVYEMGSTFKIFNTAMALDCGMVTHDRRLRRHASRSRSARFTINDYHSRRTAGSRVPEIFMYSSNIGSAQDGRWQAGTERQQDFMDRLGLLQAGRRSSCRSSASRMYPARLAADQHHDHRLRPRHRGDAAASRQPASPPSSMAACCGRRRC